MHENDSVFVGLSGGVDSAVAALRLKQQGYDVVGVFIKVWHPDFLTCNWEAERLDAMRVAAHLEIPFLTCDAEAAYRDEVAAYFISEYEAGRTPNPDVMCNQHIKFGVFLDFAKKHGAKFIATGHYARRIDGANGVELHRGIDEQKDQSYFLWSLTSAQLESALFPIGDTQKQEIREEAAAAEIPTAAKHDSQGICFLGHIDIPDFLRHYVELKPGSVLDRSGRVIGEHKGALVYTLGQRHGFTLTTDDVARTPMYVTAKDIDANTITVSTERPILQENATLALDHAVLRTPLGASESCEAQLRYRQKPWKTKITAIDDTTITLDPDEPIEAPAVGQSCVLYRGSHCLGGGIIA